MPRYHFTIKGDTINRGDPDGTQLDDDAAAETRALRVIRELKQGGGYDDPGLTMVIEDEDGRMVSEVLFSDVT